MLRNPCECKIAFPIEDCDCLEESTVGAPSTSSTSLSTVAVAVTAGLVALSVLLVLVIFMRRKSSRAQRAVSHLIEGVVPMQTNELFAQDTSLQFAPSDVILRSQLGSGEYGIVFNGLIAGGIRKGTVCAVKTLSEGLNSQDRLELLREARLMASLTHPNLVQLIGVCTDVAHTMILVELMPHGDLKTYLRMQPNITDSTLTFMGLQVARALEYLEARHVVHRCVPTP